MRCCHSYRCTNDLFLGIVLFQNLQHSFQFCFGSSGIKQIFRIAFQHTPLNCNYTYKSEYIEIFVFTDLNISDFDVLIQQIGEILLCVICFYGLQNAIFFQTLQNADSLFLGAMKLFNQVFLGIAFLFS